MKNRHMKVASTPLAAAVFALAAGFFSLAVQAAGHAISGIHSATLTLTAGAGFIDTPDGDAFQIWGYGATGNGHTGVPQYPGPTLIVNQGDAVNITLNNTLPEATSIIFPGQTDITTTGGVAGDVTQEAISGGSVTYSFTASKPGTYMYQSGTNAEIQVEMGLFGVIIVRPSGFDADNPTAYNHPDSAYDHEYLFLLSEIDPNLHYAMEAGMSFDNTGYDPVLWFINGRNGPDTLAGDFLPWKPYQPYGALARGTPGDKILLRVASASRDLHPLHTHGNNFETLARDGRPLGSSPTSGSDLRVGDFTLQAVPGATYDLVWTWTGRQLGFDIYGTPADGAPAHTCGNPNCPDSNNDGFDDGNPQLACWDATTREYCPDHGKPLPVTMPENLDLTFGGFYSGSPFLGALGSLPPGEGGLNANGGLFFMWHSHTEKELVNNDIFPGGMMTMMIIEPPGVVID